MNDELTDKQRKLVDTIVTTGCTIKEAGIIAGYSTKNNTLSRALGPPKKSSMDLTLVTIFPMKPLRAL